MPINHEDFMRCYDQQMTDEEISNELGVSFGMIAIHRNKHRGLRKWNAYTKNLCRYKNPQSIALFEELYKKGMKDRDIAVKLKCSINVVYRMRQERGLECNRSLRLKHSSDG